MTRHRSDLTKGSVLPSTWVNAIMEFVGVSDVNFVLSRTGTTSVQVVAGTGNDQASIGVSGRWRYISSTVTATHPGGVAGTYDVYVTASDNDFTPADPGDATVYAFGLAIRASGSPPTTALWRKVGTVLWNGTAITELRQTVGNQANTGVSNPTSTVASESPVSIAGVASQSAPLLTAALQRGVAALFTLNATGGLSWSDGAGGALDTFLRRTGAGVLKTDGAFQAASYAVDTTPLNSTHLADAATVIPTAAQKQALVGSSGSPASGNRYVTELDPRIAALAGSSQIVFTQTIGDGVATSFPINHNLGTRTLVAQVYETASPFGLVETNVEKTSTNQITVSFENYIPSSGQFIVIIMAPGGVAVPSSSIAASAVEVKDTGQVGQRRAGRQLTVADFTDMGLVTPPGLFNLSSTANLGTGGALVNKGAVPFAPGVSGSAGEAAQFAGSSAQALYVLDTGSADPFRLRVGSIGCWFRTAKRGVQQQLVAKDGTAAPNRGWAIAVKTNSAVGFDAAPDGSGFTIAANGLSDVADDRWHFVVATIDGTTTKLYVDGVLEVAVATTGILPLNAGPFNIGAAQADATTGSAGPHFGRIDEAFVTPDLLSEEQVRMLYAVKVPHGLTVPVRQAGLTVRRRRRGAFLATTDFPSTPLRLYNIQDGALNDLGANATNLAFNVGTGTQDTGGMSGPDGKGPATVFAGGHAIYLAGTHAGLSSTDAGLPSGLSTRSYGIWFKTSNVALQRIMSWGSANADAGIQITSSGTLGGISGTAQPGAGFFADGQWHHAVVVQDNASADGVRQKVYADGKLIAIDTVLNTLTLAGAASFRLGSSFNGGNPFTGLIARAFVHSAALTPEQIMALYQKGSQTLQPSVRDAGEHVEGIDASNVYFIGDTLEPQHQIDLSVSA